MECFIKKIFLNKVDEASHRQFVRFGKGVFAGRSALSLMKTDKIKLGGSFEYTNDFVDIAAELVNAKFSGIIISKEDLDFHGKKKKSGLNVYEVSDIDSNKIKEIRDKAYYMLLDASGPGLELKMKKKLPKPGKSGESKIDDKFCVLETSINHWQKIKEAFFWDVADCRKGKVHHTYEITSLEMPKGEKDFEQIRLKTKRKGALIRKLNIDGQEKQERKEFEA